MKYLAPMLEDTFVTRTGLEKDQLDLVFAYQKLHENPDFQGMKKDYESTIAMITKDAEERGKL